MNWLFFLSTEIVYAQIDKCWVVFLSTALDHLAYLCWRSRWQCIYQAIHSPAHQSQTHTQPSLKINYNLNLETDLNIYFDEFQLRSMSASIVLFQVQKKHRRKIKLIQKMEKTLGTNECRNAKRFCNGFSGKIDLTSWEKCTRSISLFGFRHFNC